MEKGIEIYKSPNGEITFNVDTDQETIWATQAQIAQIFNVDRSRITHHLRNIFKDGELDENSVCAFSAHTAADRKTYQVKTYNLDAIISVGYRVNSKKATDFRIWATKTLKSYLTDGIAINQRRLKSLDSKKLAQVEGMMGVVRRLIARQALDAGEANGVLEVISKYSTSFQMLKQYDDGHIDLTALNTTKKRQKSLDIDTCNNIIDNLRLSTHSGELFGKPRNQSFEGILHNIFQSYDDKELYPSIAEKASHLLYFIIKDHPFYDGNKRIGALLFIVFLTINGEQLTKNGETKISDRALTALALLIAESEPSEKPLITSLVIKLLEN
ncbi:virulence protein RhuM/Fic/DOC family protein [Candidatus Saccharibacteria bacterium]|nr:virulence protein RhuM/Fic/DOC family protein [Candidatus Saccharibacteria bacterium]